MSENILVFVLVHMVDSSICCCAVRWLSVCVCSLQEAQVYAEENSLLFMETSAKTAMNVNDIFLAIGKCLTSKGSL